MSQLNQSSNDEIKINIQMTKFDCYLSQVYGQFMSPYVFIFMALFLWLIYFDLKYFHFEKEVIFLAVSVARTILWILSFIYLFPLLVLIFQIVTNKLKGILGGHEFIFRQNEFVEKTDYNEQILAYENVVKLLKVQSRYFICLQGGHSFLFHKNYLSENILRKINIISKDTFKPKRFLMPSVAFILFLFSFSFIVSVYPLSKYTIIKTRIPIQVSWDDESLYIFSGEIATGHSQKYVTFPFFQNEETYISKPLFKTHLRMWVAEHMEINKYELNKLSHPGTIYLLDKKLYFMSFDDEVKRKVFLWRDNTFQEVKDADFVLNRIQKDMMDLSSKDSNIVNEFTWHEKAGKDNMLEVLIGGSPLMIKIKKKKNYDQKSKTLETFAIYARWPKQSSTFDTIFTDQYGQLSVDKEAFEDTFGL